SRFSIVELEGGAALPVTLRRLEPGATMALLRADRATPDGLGARLTDVTERVKAAVFRIPPERSPEMLPWLNRVLAATRESSIFPPGDPTRKPPALPLPRRQAPAQFGVAGIPLPAPGLYTAELEGARLGASLLGKPASMYVPAAALVTNLAV